MIMPEVLDKVFFTELFQAAVDAARPETSLQAFLPAQPKGRTIIIGAGKGAAQMAATFETLWSGDFEGCVVTRYGYGATCNNIEIIEASHPVPDEAGFLAGQKLLDLVSNLTQDDLVIALITGGGSALLPAPPHGFSLDDEIVLNKALLASGAPIAVMNTIRKHFSRIKGGRLAAAAYPAKCISLIVSDIPGDIASMVASGPTLPDETTAQNALDHIRNYQITLPDNLINFIASNLSAAPKPDDKEFIHNTYHIIASAGVSLEAAACIARKNGIAVAILSDAMEGEAKEVAKVHAALAKQVSRANHPFQKPVLLLSGGELTVTMQAKGNGKGGPNTEFLLAFAKEIDGVENISAFSADTDGIDGSEDNAGAFADGTSMSRMRAAGLDPLAHLARHDAWTAFHTIDDIFKPGPTGTNVNDLRAILIR